MVSQKKPHFRQINAPLKNALIIIFFTLSTAVSATTYYIDPTGNNSNDGSIAHPWLTLTYACAHTKTSGDIIHVNAGIYIEIAQSTLAVSVSIEGVGVTSIIKAGYNSAPLLMLASAAEGTN